MEGSYPLNDAEDEERLAQIIGPARAVLARVDALVLSTQRAIANCMIGLVFCLSGAVAATVVAVVVIAPGYEKMVVIAAAAALSLCAVLFGYAMTVLRFDLAPLNTYGQELRGGLRTAEQALFQNWPEMSA